MATTQLSDVVVPEEFTDYQVANSVEKTALYQSGALAKNAAISDQLGAGAASFTVPFWLDLGNAEANVVNDDPAAFSVPNKIGSGKQVVRKSYLHNSWSAMNLASELSGSDAVARVKSRVLDYWDRQWQRRVIGSLRGVLANNIKTAATGGNDGDMVLDISALTGGAEKFSASAVIDAAATMGDRADDLVAIAMHSATYNTALKADLIQFRPDSEGKPIRTYRGLAVIVDDGMPVAAGKYTTILLGAGVVGFGATSPRIAAGTEIENLPSAGNGGGQAVLHSRFNVGIHPLGFTWVETNVVGESPAIAELSDAANWKRVVERKAVPLAYLVHKL